MNTTTSTSPVDQQRLCSALGHLLQAVEALEDAARNPSPDPNSPPLLKCRQELRAATEDLKHGWWQCQCCKVLREPNWFTYRVRGHQKEPWIEPACAMCAREMFSEGPFPPPNAELHRPCEAGSVARSGSPAKRESSPPQHEVPQSPAKRGIVSDQATASK